jgi:hypothetical protein
MWWHTVTHGRGSEGETGEWSGWPVPFTLPRNMMYPALLPLMSTPRLPVVDWTDAPADLNGLVRFAERRNIFSARVPSRFNWPLPSVALMYWWKLDVNCVVTNRNLWLQGKKGLRTKFGRGPPRKSSVYACNNLSDKSGCICKAKG